MQSIALLPILFYRKKRRSFPLRDSNRMGCRLDKGPWKDRESERLCQDCSFLSVFLCDPSSFCGEYLTMVVGGEYQEAQVKRSVQ